MSVLWQTGEPPCETDLIVEYEFKIGRKAISMLQHRDGAWLDECDEAMPPIKVIRWSTLDAAPDVVGRLESILRRNENQWISLDLIDGQFEAALYSAVSDKDDVEYHAPTLATAIEQLCGGTDEDTTNTPRAT